MHEAPARDEDIVRAARIDEGADPGRNDWETRVIWSAGFFDGEGYVGLGTSAASGNWSVRMSVGQLVREPLDILQGLFGGSICRDRHGPKPMYKWACMSNIAARSLREMLPYLTVKRQQAQIALEFHDGKQGRQWRYVPESEKTRGADYMMRLRAVRP